MEIEVKKLYYDRNLIAHINALEVKSSSGNFLLKLESEEPMIRVDSYGSLCFLEPENVIGCIQIEDEYIPLASSKSISFPEEVLDLLDTLLDKCTLQPQQLAEIEKGKKLIKRQLKTFMTMINEDTEELVVFKTVDSIDISTSLESFSPIIKTTKFIDGLMYYFTNLLKKEISYNEVCKVLDKKLSLKPGEAQTILVSEIATHIA